MAELMSGNGRCDGSPESGARKTQDEYDHDRISIHDLIALGVTVVAFGRDDAETLAAEVTPDVPQDGLALLPCWDSACATSDAVAGASDDTETSPSATRVSGCAVQDVEKAVAPTTTGIEAPVAAHEVAADEVFPFNIFDADEDDSRPGPEDPLDQLWYLEVPEAEDDTVVRNISRTTVSSDERAMQLARAFLRDEGLHSAHDLDLLTDIIRHRGWSGVQFQVRGLVLAGHAIAQIHRMFQLTDVWLHCVESDTLAPERWHGGKRLTWLEAAHLLEFLGHDAELEQIADFLSSEQDIWQELRRDSGQLATFKNYLFEYRMSPRTQVNDGVWQRNLDPDDTRSFDGTRNPLYLSCWWDEPIDGGTHDVRRLFGAVCDPARIADWLSPDTDGVF